MMANDNKDPIWKYAKPTPDRNTFECIFCEHVFQGGPEKIKYHLSGVGGKCIRACKELSATGKVTDDVWNEAFSGVKVCVGKQFGKSLNVASSKKRKTEATSSCPDGGLSEKRNPPINSRDEVGYSVGKVVEMGGINDNLVVQLPYISNSGPVCKLPSRSELGSQLIPSFRPKVENYVRNAKDSWIKTGCTLVPISWLNEKLGSYFLSIFGCTVERTVLLKTVEIPVAVADTANLLEATAHSLVEDVGADNIVQCLQDGSVYADHFSNILHWCFPHLKSACAAHGIQFFFQRICNEVGWVKNILFKINSIVDYIYSDSAILELVTRKCTKGTVLKHSLGLNCISNYKALDSMLEVKQDLYQLVKSTEWLGSRYGEGYRGSEVTAYIEDSEMWKQGEMVQIALAPLFQVYCFVNSQGVSCGYLYGLMEIVEHSISQLVRCNPATFQMVEDIFMEEKGKIIGDIHRMAAFLNPAYTCSEKGKTTPMNSVVNLILKDLVTAPSDGVSIDVSGYNKMLSGHGSNIEPGSAKRDHPCEWWEWWGKRIPELRKLAIRILSQPCSTSSCKSTIDAILTKQQMELEGDPIDFDLKINAVLMEKHSSGEMWKIDLDEFSRYMSVSRSQEVLVEAHRPLKQLNLRFTTRIASSIRTHENVEGENGCQIHVFLEDPTTGGLVEDGMPPTLLLTITVVDGFFPSESSSEKDKTRECFNQHDLSRHSQYMNGDLEVTLNRGKGTLGNFSFNRSSVHTSSGKFMLAVKTLTGEYGGFRIHEGISNAFIVEDAEGAISTQCELAPVDLQNSPSSSNLDWLSEMAVLLPDHTLPNSNDTSNYLNDTLNYSYQGINHSLAQTAATGVKKKTLTLQLRSRGREVTMKRGSQALERKRREKEVPKPSRRVYSTGSNNVNQQEDGEEANGEVVELKGIDCLSSASASAMTLFGVKGACLSDAKPVEEINEVALTTHPSTAMQLSLTGGVHEPREVQLASANDVNQKEDGNPMALNGIDILKPESHAIMLFGVQVAGGEEPTGEAHENQSPTPRVMPTTEDIKEISYDGYDAEIQESGKKSKDVAARQFLDPYAETNFPIASEPEMNSTWRTDEEDDTPQKVEKNQCFGDNYKSESSVKYTPLKKRAKYSDTKNHGTGDMQEEMSITDYDYDVFLSFRGKDTRHSFTKFLYQYMVDAGIKAFVDKPATLSSELIDQAVINAIDKSKISICILSETYASSAWCLRELATMVHMNKVIIPIFYDVAPDDVQLKTNIYTDDLARHETKYDKVEVQKWREALRKVGEIKGFEPKRMSLLDSINELIGLISSKLKVKPKYELQHFVGMEDRVKNALSLLDIESGDNRILGIVGLGGIGKTTLAKCIYNRLLDKFDKSCFLEDVGVDSSMETEMTRIRGLCQKKVLIVLDDVHHTGNPITDLFNTNWFGSGSRIIVTTRNRQCLANMKNVFWYGVEGMDPERALKLFSKKAFGLESPPEEYQDLSKQVVSICEGHPLALTVVGTFLHGQERPYWERVITDMQKGVQYPSDDKLVIVIRTREDSFPDELCRGHPLVVQLMTSLLNGIGKQLWESKIDKVTKMVQAFQKMMTECKKINAITEGFGAMFRDMVRWGPSGGDRLQLTMS